MPCHSQDIVTIHQLLAILYLSRVTANFGDISSEPVQSRGHGFPPQDFDYVRGRGDLYLHAPQTDISGS